MLPGELKSSSVLIYRLTRNRPPPPRPNPTQPMERSTPAMPGRLGNRRSSVIIHGDTTDPIQRDSSSRPSTADQSTSIPLLPPPQPTRTRKAKESQYKLGFGRPVAAGGSGARAVTKSVSTPRRLKRAKSSMAVVPSEATITEGAGIIVVTFNVY